MDLSNKQFLITSTDITSIPAKTICRVEVKETIEGTSVKRIIGTFDFEFEEFYGGPTDPALLSKIVELLELLP